MAAVKLKSNENSCTKSFTEHKNENIPEELTFRLYDAFLIVLSMGTFLVDLSTDAVLVVEYFENGHFYWAISTLLLVVFPAAMVQVFSMRWHIMDESAGLLHWVAHVFLLGLIHRYVVALKTGFEARSSGDPLDFQRLYHQQNDICMLRLFESFMESAPQLVLQLYIMISLEDWRSWTGVSAVASLASLAWAVAAYTKAMRRARPDKRSLSAVGFLLQAVWRGSMITARITALVLFAVGFKAWLFLLLGVHWIGMTAWIMFQHTDFCQSPWEEKIYNCVVGVIYCFCFFNLKEGRSRKRMLVFYVIVILQNVSCLGMFIGFTGMTRFNLVIFGTTAVVGGTILGIMSMLLYYGFFHPAGHIKFHSEAVNHDARETQMSTMKSENTATIRSLKHCWDLYKEQPTGRINNMPSNGGSPLSDDATTDKNLLLNNWAPCQTATPTEFLNLGLEIADEIEIVKKASEEPRTLISTTKYDVLKRKRRGICSPEELGIDTEHPLEDMSSLEDIAATTDANLLQRPSFSPIHEIGIDPSLADGKNTVILDEMTRQKRRAICSPIDFDVFNSAHDMQNNKEENVLSMSVADASTESGGEILCEQFSGTVTEKKCETEPCNVNHQDVPPGGSEDAPSEILSVPSEVLSAHDYENICAVNIAREAWGLRSWRGYSDIETWLHDDSVVRDRRRDTLTSTVTTITSASSDNSTTSGEPLAVTISPPPIPCRRPNVGIRVQRSRQDDYLDTLVDDLAECERNHNLPDFVSEQDEFNVFIARPYVIDQNGAFHPVTTLDTIMEEHEESSTEAGDSIKLRRRHDSASTLVATIDEIRRGSSLCNLYNSTWDSRSCSSASTLSGSPQKSPSKNKFPFDSVYSTSLPSLPSSSLSTNPYSPVTRDSHLISKLHDSLNDDCRVSSKMVPSTMSHGPEIVLDAVSYLSPPDSVAEHSAQQQASCAEAKKTGKSNRIRRKFSLLREKFEHKESDHDISQQLDTFTSADVKNCTKPISDFCVTVKNDIVLDISAEKMEEPSDKENVIPAVTSRIKQWNSILKGQNTDQRLHFEVPSVRGETERETSKPVKVGYLNLKERRSVFLKQVLSPPRFQSKPKRTSLSAAWKGVYVS
ncbi:uncharacterized protein LOC126272874 isoform X1 [Schistocerca gregaria]|uniref:uncharacterized protein LOC126272874 isoform X1 n=1 Tax=Schistocerca gregaria TaxID=7010 RepID=UPI00211DB918|nr:uncharacterized protein LOC126272874 isoform X1 [Schistocerca gregaria]